MPLVTGPFRKPKGALDLYTVRLNPVAQYEVMQKQDGHYLVSASFLDKTIDECKTVYPDAPLLLEMRDVVLVNMVKGEVIVEIAKPVPVKTHARV